MCDCGSRAFEVTTCEEAVVQLANANGKTPARSIQTGSDGKCLDGSWGAVPMGCSAQSGGDWTAHFKRGDDTGEGCISDIYQLVCSGLSCTTATVATNATSTTTTAAIITTTAAITTTTSKSAVEQARLHFRSLINTTWYSFDLSRTYPHQQQQRRLPAP